MKKIITIILVVAMLATMIIVAVPTSAAILYHYEDGKCIYVIHGQEYIVNNIEYVNGEKIETKSSGDCIVQYNHTTKTLYYIAAIPEDIDVMSLPYRPYDATTKSNIYNEKGTLVEWEHGPALYWDKAEHLVLDSHITGISNYYFCGMYKLKDVTFEGRVSTIAEGAFKNCKALETINFPSSLISIGEKAFYGCKSLKEVDIPDKVTGIGLLAFSGCTSLESVTIGKGYKGTTQNVWSTGSNLKNIYFNAEDCKYFNLGSNVGVNVGGVDIVIGPDVKKIPDKFIEYTEQQKDVLDMVYGEGYSATQNPIINSLVISENVKEIGSNSFKGECKIKTLTLPASLEKIAANAFSECEIEEVIYKGNSCTSYYMTIEEGNETIANAIPESNGTGHVYTMSTVQARTFEQEQIDEYTCTCGDKYCEYTSPYEHYAKGDLTGDGKVNAVDANMISNYIIGHVAYDMQMEDAGDLNGDGKVGVIDVNMLMKKIAS